ncbi:MAG TPA: M4 family metallopeptidase, partial [Kribbellaceae bacterium]
MVSRPKLRTAALVSALAGLASVTAVAVGMAGADAAQLARPPKPKSPAESRTLAASSAGSFIEAEPAAVLAGTGEKYLRRPVISANGSQYVPYERTYDDLPVVGGDFVVVTDADGNVTGTSVAQSRPIGKLSTKPVVTSARAAQASRARVDQVRTVSKPRLVVYAHGTPKLAWQTRVTGRDAGAPSVKDVYVDARTGKVLKARERVVFGEGTGKFNGPNPLALNTTKGSTTYSMTDPSIKNLSCQDAANNQTFTGPDDKWGDGDGSHKETGCVDALFAAQTENKMLSAWLGRNGFDGNGGGWPIRVGLDDVNAYYDGSQVQIGHNQASPALWISSMDVVGHELGHGIDDHTPGGISDNGTQEFVADVFGALTEAYANEGTAYDEPDYLVGEEINLVGSGPIRNMYDPSKVDGDPNCYSSSIPNTEVHSAAGPGNHWFYLLAEGNKPANGPASPTCNNSNVTGIGIQKAGKIMYNAMLLKTSGSSYLKYRTWTLTAAKNLFPGSCTEFDAVKAAWNAVSVPAQTGDPTCTAGPTPTPTPTTSPTTSPTSSPTTSPTPSPTTSPTTSPTSSPTSTPTGPSTGQLIKNPGFESGT